MLHKPGVTQNLARFACRSRLERHPGAGPPRGQARPAEFLRGRARGLPHRPGGDRPDVARRIFRSQAGDRHRPQRARRRAERGLPERSRRQRLRLLRHASADRNSSDRTRRAGAVRARRAASRDAAPSCCSPSSSASRSNAGSAASSRPGTTPRVGTSPQPAACSVPPPAPASSLGLDEQRKRSPRSATRRHNLRACANAWAGRPRASASATPRATACGRRCWRRKVSRARPSRSPACKAFSMRWRSRRAGRASSMVWAKPGRSRRTRSSPIPAASSSIPCSISCWSGGARIRPPRSTRVVVRGNPLLAARTDRPDISTGRESQVSVQHAVAAALVKGQAGLAQFTDECAARSRHDRDAPQGRGGPRSRDRDHRRRGRAVDDATAAKHALSTSAARGSPVNP